MVRYPADNTKGPATVKPETPPNTAKTWPVKKPS